MPPPAAAQPLRSNPPVARVLVALALLTCACQPVDTSVTPDEGGTAETPASTPAAAPLPEDPAALLTAQASTAQEWQDTPVPVEVAAALTDGVWTSASTMYLAPDADRFLLVTAGEGAGQQRPTLSGLGLGSVPATAFADIPPLPELAQGPEQLAKAAAAALEGCGASGPVTAVVYGSGAPAAWDGERWTEPPRWTATVTIEGGAGVVLDPVTAAPAPQPCVSAEGRR